MLSLLEMFYKSTQQQQSVMHSVTALILFITSLAINAQSMQSMLRNHAVSAGDVLQVHTTATVSHAFSHGINSLHY